MKFTPFSEQAARANRRALRAALICVAATIVSLAPFVTRAFHMDDIYFLYVARQICAHPADPFGFRHNWDGTEVATTQITRNGPLNGYYVAAAAACLGWSEAALHLAFLVPAVAAVLGAYFLAVRFCTEPLLAALTTLLCPAFMVCSTTIMADTMMLAFFVWAVVLWLRSAESGSHFVAILSGCLIAAASMTRFFALVSLVPLLLAYSLLRWRRIGWRVLYLTIPLAVFADYECAMRALYGYTPLYHAGSTALVQGREGSWLVWRGIVTLCFAGGSLATLIFYAPMLWSRRVLAAGLLGVGLLAGLLACRESLAEDTLPSDGALRLLITSQFSVFVGAGFSLLVLAIADLWQSRDAESALLALWTLGTLAFCWIFNWTINGRTMLSMAPAASILIFRRIQQRAGISTDRHLPGKLVPLVLAGLLAAAITWADSRLANSARTAAVEFHRRYGAQKSTVWFTGHWGFQYYMESYGFKAYDTKYPRIGPSDVLIVPLNNPNVPESLMAWHSKCAKFDLVSSRVLATMHPAVMAGFHTSEWGLLPFAFGPVPCERYFIANGAVINQAIP